MPVTAIGNYEFESRDRVANFHGNLITYWHWEEHLMFCAALALPFPPAMLFGDVTGKVLPDLYGAHPETASIDWKKASWMLDGRPFKPDFGASLAANGLVHKSLVRFWTPGLHGIHGTAT